MRSARLRPEGLPQHSPGEARTARWRDFALADAVWTIPADVTMTRTEHQLPLTDQVLVLLRAHRAPQQARGVDSVFLVPARGQANSANQVVVICVYLHSPEQVPERFHHIMAPAHQAFLAVYTLALNHARCHKFQ